ncbi:PKD domain-containing protein [Rhodanobacter koreensis]
MPNHFRLKMLVTAIGMAATASAFAAPTSFVALTQPHHATSLRNGDVAQGPLAFSQPMHVVISLKLQNKSKLDAYVADPKHKALTPAEFTAMYAPTQAQAQAVANYLKQSGFTNVTIAPNRMLVEADGHADTVQSSFHTSMVHVRTHDGRDAYANSNDVMIPAELQSTVQSVLGLDNVHMSHIFARRVRANAVHTDATSGTAVGHNPLDFPKIYGASSLAPATSITVGNVVSGQMSDVLNDIKSFESTNGLTSLVPSIEGPGNTGSVSASGDGEWDLDTQDMIAMSGGLKSLILYDAASLSDAALTTDYNLAVTDDKAVAINVSLGECETDAKSAGTTTTEDAVFEQAVAQGQTFSVSAGDSGANECGTGSGTTPSWPASSQYVIAAGGTEIYTTGTTTWASETVWNNLNESEGATGGSPSTFEPMPSWQSGVGQNAGHTTRGVPDIAYEGSPDSGALVIVDGQANQQIGGTSLSSPLFVGAWARIQAANGGALGFAAPLIYKAAAANYATDFHDITSGNNSGETAATGWDYTTGFGSIIVSALSSNVGGSGSTGGTPTANFSDTTSGLTATFTDSSTDSGGTISSHAWTFGDGGTSTATSPSHTYAAAGTYSVTETVTDSVSGKTSSKTASVTVASAGGTPTANFTDTVSGLTATFTDSSTDAGGTIGSHAWTFGDGSTSTATSPSHTYAAAGTYSVTETVTDSVDGQTSSKTASVTVSSGGTPTQILVNTGFETGKATPWTMSSGTLCNSSSSSSSYCGSGETSHAGSWFAWLDGYGTSHTDTVSQKVAIPSGKTSATLQYYLHIDSTKTTAVDTLTVQVLNSSGTVLGTVGSFTSKNTNTGYAVETANLSAYIGQTVTLKFTGKETSSSGNTDFTLDDITLTVQ